MNPWIRMLRPRQWVKNVFVFAPLFFSGEFRHAAAWEQTLLAALGFLCVSCVVYICNDLRDIAEDRSHPLKKNRPLAAGQIGAMQAALLACALAGFAAFILLLLPRECAAVALVYIALNALYTLRLKQIAIVDAFCVAACYVLRVLMGGYALSVALSPWIILATFLLALFLVFGKRYHEMGFTEYAQSRASLRHYSRDLLDRLVTVSGGAALMTYAIYAAEIAQKTGKVEMIYTAGFVAFGLFRYLQSIHVYKQGGEPEAILLQDKLQLVNLVCWLAVTLGIMF